MTSPGGFVPGVVLDADTDMDELPGGGIALNSNVTGGTGVGLTATALGAGTLTTSPSIAGIAGRRYKIHAHVQVRQRTSAGLVTLEIRRADAVTIVNSAFMTLGTDQYGILDFCAVDLPGAITLSYTPYLKTSANTVDWEASATSPAWITLEDLGPF